MKNFGSHGCIKTKSSPNPYSRIWRTHFLGLNRKGSEKVLIFQCPLEVRMIFLQPVQRTALLDQGQKATFAGKKQKCGTLLDSKVENLCLAT